MAYTAWSVIAGEQPTAAKWNILGTNDSSFNDGTGIGASAIGTAAIASGIQIAQKMSNPYKFRVYRNAAMNTVNGTTKVLFDAKTYDTSSNFDAVTNNRFVAPVSGFYTFSATAQTVSSANFRLDLYKNGSVIADGVNNGGSGVNQGSIVSDQIQLVATDYIEVFVSAASIAALFVGSAGVYFSGSIISAT